ncbi:hypothetical protein BDR05DRAFT_949437 [Suillus weaverae]|nr:hypothetical protein BDR05DRAFT_949437 [Suillus weaverae]
MSVVCHDLDVGLDSLTEDVANILSLPWNPCDMSTLAEYTNAPPPFTCVTSGRYIGVFSGEDYVPMVKGITNTVYFNVKSLEVGERALRNVIEQSDIVRFPVPSQ